MTMNVYSVAYAAETTYAIPAFVILTPNFSEFIKQIYKQIE